MYGGHPLPHPGPELAGTPSLLSLGSGTGRELALSSNPHRPPGSGRQRSPLSTGLAAGPRLCSGGWVGRGSSPTLWPRWRRPRRAPPSPACGVLRPPGPSAARPSSAAGSLGDRRPAPPAPRGNPPRRCLGPARAHLGGGGAANRPGAPAAGGEPRRPRAPRAFGSAPGPERRGPWAPLSRRVRRCAARSAPPASQTRAGSADAGP